MSEAAGEPWEFTSSSAEATRRLGLAIGELAKAGDLVALVGELGAGKTQLVRGMAVGLGVDESVVSSPTFVMVHEYSGDNGRPVFVHIDAYRVRSAEDLHSMGWDPSPDGEFRRGAVVAVEWADRLADALGREDLHVGLSHAGGDARRIEIAPGGRWIARAARLREIVEAMPR